MPFSINEGSQMLITNSCFAATKTTLLHKYIQIRQLAEVVILNCKLKDDRSAVVYFFPALPVLFNR